MKILICGHSRFAEGVESAQELIAGKIEDVSFLKTYVDDKDFKKQLAEIINDSDEWCILTDLFGGSVNQEVMQYLKQTNINVVTGVNLPLILEIVLANKQGQLDKNAISSIVENSKDQIIYVNDRLKISDSDDFE